MNAVEMPETNKIQLTAYKRGHKFCNFITVKEPALKYFYPVNEINDSQNNQTGGVKCQKKSHLFSLLALYL